MPPPPRRWSFPRVEAPGVSAPAASGLHHAPPVASVPGDPLGHASPRLHAARPLPAPAPPGRAVQTHRGAGAARSTRDAELRGAGSPADRLSPRRCRRGLPPCSAGASHCEPSSGPSSRLRSSSGRCGCQEGKHPGIPEERAGRRRPLPAPAPCSGAHAATFLRIGVCLADGSRPLPPDRRSLIPLSFTKWFKLPLHRVSAGKRELSRSLAKQI